MWLLATLAAAQTLPNGELSSGFPAFDTFPTIDAPVPPVGWTLIGAPGLLDNETVLDCAEIANDASGAPVVDDGTFIRAVHSTDGYYVGQQQGLTTTLSGLTANTPYLVRFDQALVRNAGQATGYWEVTFGLLDPQGSPPIALPATTGRTQWERVSVGPFFHAGGTGVDFTLLATIDTDGTSNETTLNNTPPCAYAPSFFTTDLLIDNIEVLPDLDADGLSEDEEDDLGTDPNSADTDQDGIADGDEEGYGTDPVLPDSDFDGISDGDEIANGTDPLEATDPPPETTDTGTTDTGTQPQETIDTGDLPEGNPPPTGDRSGSEGNKGGALGCACAHGASPSPGLPPIVLGLCALAAARRDRRWRRAPSGG